MPTYSNPIRSLTAYLSEDGKTVYVKETTGIYDAGSNPNGWGGPGGLDISDVTTSKLIVKRLIANDEFEITLNPASSLPSNDNTVLNHTSFLMDSLGGTAGDVFPDDILMIQSKISDGITDEDTILTIPTIYLGTLYNAKCCVNRRLSKIQPEDCDCNRDDIDSATESWTWLLAASLAGCAGQVDRFKCILSYITKLCNLSTNDCGCN
jgi:hypothetical protein